MPSAVALVPARSGSQRVPGKNVMPLAGHPLIAYSIAGAQEAGIFDAVVVSTDTEEIADIARRYGAEVPGLRPSDMSTATSFDIEWVLHVMRDRDEEIFAILRPTSPFRGGDVIRRAYERLVELGDAADSIRAVEPARQHPGKMWTVDGRPDRAAAAAARGRDAAPLAPVPGAAEGVRAELEPRAGVVPGARRPGADDLRRASRAVLHRGRRRASRSTTRRTSSWPSGWSRAATRRSPRSR